MRRRPFLRAQLAIIAPYQFAKTFPDFSYEDVRDELETRYGPRVTTDLIYDARKIIKQISEWKGRLPHYDESLWEDNV